MVKFLLLLFTGFFAVQVTAQNTIADARAAGEGQSVTVSGIVTNGSELGVIRYMQDASAGIAVYDDKLSALKRGDSITVTGTLDDYNNLLEITSVSNHTVHASGKTLPQPASITIEQIGEEHEGELVQLQNIQFSNGGGTFASNKNYNITDGQHTGQIRIGSGNPLVGQTIPSGPITLTAICSQYSFQQNDTQSGYQLLPRDANDLSTNSTISITSPIMVSEITKAGFTLSWKTNAEGSSEVRYGATNELGALTNHTQGSSSASGEEFQHEVTIDNLSASEVIFAQPFSVTEGDTAFSAVRAFVTESNSTGKINIYFNTTIDESKATETVAKDVGSKMADTLAAYINRATESIDFCIYNFNNDKIRSALDAAHNRGVNVRVITCGSTAHVSVGDLSSAIPVLERPDIEQGGIMHNKFAIFDGNVSDANKAWVWSGSTNLTYDQLVSDANNMVFIQDQSLAKTYEIEFEEMWGSTGNTPNASKAKFGANKTDNTPHELVINGNRVQSYFSPSDNTNQKLIDAMNTADSDLSVETMLITRTDLANAIASAHERGANVCVMTNNQNDNTSTVNNILNDELPDNKFVFDSRAPHVLHHKLAIIDATNTSSDPQVITGSHNWSNSANSRNDENTLIIHNSDIANQYYQQFAARFWHNQGTLVTSVSTIDQASISIYPNPSYGQLNISAAQPVKSIRLYSISGNLLKEWSGHNQLTPKIYVPRKMAGVFLLQVELTTGKVTTSKVVKY